LLHRYFYSLWSYSNTKTDFKRRVEIIEVIYADKKNNKPKKHGVFHGSTPGEQLIGIPPDLNNL
jgi:hypothetical protein